ncbi:MAG: UvrD-helicase domain-containing protein [Promethearchaeota archaeon]
MLNFKITNDKIEILKKINYGEKYLIQGEAGTGKTLLGVLIGKKLITKIKSSQKILYLTFSKLAKWQIKNCISLLEMNNHLTKEEKKRLEVHNFHSLWWKLLKDYRAFLGIKKSPIILLEKELEAFSEDCLGKIPKELIPDEFITQKGGINQNKRINLLRIFKGSGLLFSRWNSNNFGKYGKLFNNANEFLTRVKELIIKRNIEGNFSHTETVYWIDKLLEKHFNLLNLLRYRFPIVIIDEFQDIDITQLDIINKLMPSTLIALADKKQTIHQWRGADPKRIENFCNYYKISNEHIYELIEKNRFKTEEKEPPKLEWISLTYDLNDPIQLNTAKKAAKFECKKLALKALKERKRLAILCRTNNQADDITEFIRNTNDKFSGLICERLGSENSPFEKAREILLNLILIKDRQACINYIANDIYFNIFPEKDRCTNRSRRDHLKERYNNSYQTYELLNQNFCNGLKNLINILNAYEEIKNWKSNRSIINCLKFVLNKLQRIKNSEWKEMTQDEKRNLIDYLILRYENIVLSSIPKFSISIMTAHQSKSREFDWVLIPWYSSVPWNYQEGNSWDCSKEQDRNLFHTIHTRAKYKFYIIRTINNLPNNVNKKTNIQVKINNFL